MMQFGFLKKMGRVERIICLIGAYSMLLRGKQWISLDCANSTTSYKESLCA